MKHSKPSPRGAHAERAGTRPPRITTLSDAECQALLTRHSVGRMAHTFHDRVDITPIHYIYADPWLFARTSHGAKTTILAHSRWVAFEVDEIEGVFDWRSVVVHGAAYPMPRDGTPLDVEHWSRGIELLRRIVPATGTDDDPVPYRDLVFGIHVDSMTGRASTTRD